MREGYGTCLCVGLPVGTYSHTTVYNVAYKGY